MDLEQRCVKPGEWRIEGWTVTQGKIGGRRVWRAEGFDEVFTKPTLVAVREEIADRIEQSRGTT